MTKTHVNFVERVLKIRYFNAAIKFKYFQPKNWKVFYLFQRYLKLIVKLIIIWESILAVLYPVPYADYCEVNNRIFDHLFTELKKQVDLPSNQPVNLLADQSSPDTKVSLTVQKYQRIRQGSSSHGRGCSSQSSRQTYKTTTPNPIESVIVLVFSAYTAPDSKSFGSKSFKCTKKSSHHKKYSDYDWCEYVSLDSDDIRAGLEPVV